MSRRPSPEHSAMLNELGMKRAAAYRSHAIVQGLLKPSPTDALRDARVRHVTWYWLRSIERRPADASDWAKLRARIAAAKGWGPMSNED